MSGLIAELADLLSIPDKPLDSSEVGPDLVSAAASYSVAPVVEGLMFTLGADAKLSISAFNSADDKDSDGVLGRLLPVDTGFGEVKLPPSILQTTDRAWLKYRLEAQPRVSVSGAIAPVSFKIDGKHKAVFADYRVHARTDNTRDAVVADIADVRLASNPDDVLGLAAEEALSYQVRGELSLSVTLSWADVVVATLSDLTRLLRSGKMISLLVVPSASVSFNVGVVDDFRIVFSKGKGDRIKIAVKTADSREFGVAVAAGVTVQFADPEAVRKALNGFFLGFLGISVEKIDAVLAKGSLDDLSAIEKKIIETLIKKLGLEEMLNDLRELRERWEEFKSNSIGIFERVARAKVRAGFRYEYNRIRREDSLLVVEVERRLFRQFHRDLMLGELRNLLAWAQRPENESAVEKYLNQKTIKSTHAWGLTLGVDAWSVSGKDRKALTSVVQTNLAGDRRISYLGMRGYEGRLISDSVNWKVDLSADMENFSSDPTACDFTYGLFYKFTWSERKLKESELRKYLDTAVIWRILSPSNVEEKIRELSKHLDQKAEVSLEFTVPDETLRELLSLVSADPGVNEVRGARALAKAMPYSDMFETRRSPILREMCYTDLWLDYFANDLLAINDYSSRAALVIGKKTQLPDESQLATFEKLQSKMNPLTFAGQIHLHGNPMTGDFSAIHRNWQKFIAGLTTLHTAISPTNCGNHEVFKEVFQKLSGFSDQSLYVRAAGVYLLDLAAENGDLLKQTKRVCSIRFKDGRTDISSMSV